MQHTCYTHLRRIHFGLQIFEGYVQLLTKRWFDEVNRLIAFRDR